MQIEHLIALLSLLSGGSLVTAIAALRTINGQKAKLEAEAARLRAEAEKLQAEADSEAVETADRAIVISKRAIDDLLTTNDALRKDNAGLEKRLDVLSERVRGCEAYRSAAEAKFAEQAQTIRDVTQRVVDLKYDNDSLRLVVKELGEQNAELNAQVQGFRALAIRLHAEIDELRAELKEKDLRIQQLERQLAERETAHAAEIAERDRERERQLRRIEELETQVARLEKTVNGHGYGYGDDTAHVEGAS